MKSGKIFLKFAASALILVSCGKTGDDVSQAVKEPALMHTWRSNCIHNEIDVLDKNNFALEYYKYSGKDVVRYYEIHEDAACSKPLVKLIFGASFEVGDDSKLIAGAKNIDTTYLTATAQPMSADGAALMNGAHALLRLALGRGFCGKVDWNPAAPEVDLSGKGDTGLCEVPKTPYSDYDIAKVDGDVLRLGKAPQLFKGTRPDLRPGELGGDVVFSKNQSDIK